MDRSLGTTAQPRIQDVTPQILKTHTIYGGSDYTSPHRHASGKSLNYAKGASMQTAEAEPVTIIPRSLNYKDDVGLFGAENHFVQVQLNITGDILVQCFEERDWECGRFRVRLLKDEDAFWERASINRDHNSPIEPDGYKQARMSDNKLRRRDGFLSVTLVNKKTGLPFNDAWLDVRLYSNSRKEHPYNKMYVKATDDFYIGFHARNTRRLGYDVECVVGQEYLQESEIEDKSYIMQR